MIKALARRFFGRTQTRSLDAAGGGRRWENAGRIDSTNAAIFAGGQTIRARAGHYVRNNGWAASGVTAIVANAVGTGIRPQSEHPDQARRAEIDRLFADWSGSADAAGITDFYGLQSLCLRGMVEAGEAFLRLRVRLPGDGLPVPLQLQALDPAQVDPAFHRDLAGGVRIRAGVEFDAIGRRAAYHIFRDHPGDPFATRYDTARVPAADVIHLFTLLTPGQVRGVSWLTPVLLRLHELDGFEDAQLVRQKVAALFSGFIIDPTGAAEGFTGDRTGEVLQSGLEPGTLKVLPPGFDIKFADPAEAGRTYRDFVRTQLRHIASGLGVTYEQLSGDLEGVNYSSIRAGLIEFRRRVEALQSQVIIHQLCRPIWRRFITLAVLSGALPAPGFDRDPAPWLACKWVPQGWEWVDPLKDVQADRQAVEAGFKSRAEVIAERGRDPERVDAEAADDQARRERLGLATPPPATASKPETADA